MRMSNDNSSPFTMREMLGIILRALVMFTSLYLEFGAGSRASQEILPLTTGGVESAWSSRRHFQRVQVSLEMEVTSRKQSLLILCYRWIHI